MYFYKPCLVWLSLFVTFFNHGSEGWEVVGSDNPKYYLPSGLLDDKDGCVEKSKLSLQNSEPSKRRVPPGFNLNNITLSPMSLYVTSSTNVSPISTNGNTDTASVRSVSPLNNSWPAPPPQVVYNRSVSPEMSAFWEQSVARKLDMSPSVEERQVSSRPRIVNGRIVRDVISFDARSVFKSQEAVGKQEENLVVDTKFRPTNAFYPGSSYPISDEKISFLRRMRNRFSQIHGVDDNLESLHRQKIALEEIIALENEYSQRYGSFDRMYEAERLLTEVVAKLAKEDKKHRSSVCASSESDRNGIHKVKRVSWADQQ